MADADKDWDITWGLYSHKHMGNLLTLNAWACTVDEFTMELETTKDFH